MNYFFAETITPNLENLQFEKAISIAEVELGAIPTTEFHVILGQSLLHHVETLSLWVEDFYKKSAEIMPIEALYFEINEFDINTDSWYIDGFAYTEDGGLEDMEWLSDWKQDLATSDAFILTGYETLQMVFETIEASSNDLKNARDWCEQIIISRFMELMHTTHVFASQQKLSWATMPVYFSEHAYDFIIKSPPQ